MYALSSGTPLSLPLTALKGRNEEKITLVPVGPLTDIGMAIRLEPRIVDKIEQIILMGGAYGMGNATPAAEFCILADPEAAHIVFTAETDGFSSDSNRYNRCRRYISGVLPRRLSFYTFAGTRYGVRGKGVCYCCHANWGGRSDSRCYRDAESCYFIPKGSMNPICRHFNDRTHIKSL